MGAQLLDLPPRSDDALAGSEVVRQVEALDAADREARLFFEIATGNVPGWLRTPVSVELTGEIDGRTRVVTIRVAPDYLAVGSDTDYLRVPLTPYTAQRIADLVGASLRTPRIVDAVWRAAAVRLGPDSLPPGPLMTSVPVFQEHDRLVRARRALNDAPAGALVAGHKKDVVITRDLASRPGRVAIYGWHRLDGTPIQPLYLGHADCWVDYSHGIRLVDRTVRVDGGDHDLLDVLRDDSLGPLLGGGSTMAEPRYVGARRPTGTGCTTEDERRSRGKWRSPRIAPAESSLSFPPSPPARRARRGRG